MIYLGAITGTTAAMLSLALEHLGGHPERLGSLGSLGGFERGENRTKTERTKTEHEPACDEPRDTQSEPPRASHPERASRA
jgi:hypothetical protein